VIEGEDFCEDVFDAFVRKGDSVGSDEVHTKIYCPVRSRQTVMRIIFYVTEIIDPEFVDEVFIITYIFLERCAVIGRTLY
jgi:hypothetical protein